MFRVKSLSSHLAFFRGFVSCFCSIFVTQHLAIFAILSSHHFFTLLSFVHTLIVVKVVEGFIVNVSAKVSVLMIIVRANVQSQR